VVFAENSYVRSVKKAKHCNQQTVRELSKSLLLQTYQFVLNK